jgi:hypothetical protein
VITIRLFILYNFIYSVRKASIGFTFIALLAGINPAKSPEKIKMHNAAKTTPTLTEGAINISTGPVRLNA